MIRKGSAALIICASSMVTAQRQYPRTDDNNLHIKFLGSITLFNRGNLGKMQLNSSKGKDSLRTGASIWLQSGFVVGSRGEKGQVSEFHGT